jgi:hypothetical protein
MKIIPFSRGAVKHRYQIGILLLLLLLVALQVQAAEIAYYSDGKNIAVPAGA